MKSEESKIRISAVGVTYAALFFLSMWADAERDLFRYPSPGPDLPARMARDIFLGVGLGAVLSGLCAVGIIRIHRLRELARDFSKMIGVLKLGEIFLLAAFSSMGEEFLFRGVLQAEFGLVSASLIFGLLHIGPGVRFLPWTIFAVCVGFGLGVLYARTGNLLAPVAMHFTVNLLNLILLRRLVPKAEVT